MDSNTPITPEDPRLTAFALGQLEGAQRDAVAAVVAASPALQTAVAAVQADAQWLRGQLQAAAAQQPLSAALEAQLLKRLERETASIGEGNPGDLGVSASDAGTAVAQAVKERASGSAADSRHDLKADWHHDFKEDWWRDLEKSARRPIVWWSPFVLPFAACFVAVATVSLLWWGGSSFPAFEDTQVFAQQQAVPLVKSEYSLAAKNRRLLTSKNEGLFASRAWAYGHDGRPVRETTMSVQGMQGYFFGEEFLLAADTSQQMEAVAAEPAPYRSAVDSQAKSLVSTSARAGSIPVQTDLASARADLAERSAQVLAEATTLVRPIAAETLTGADATAAQTVAAYANDAAGSPALLLVASGTGNSAALSDLSNTVTAVAQGVPVVASDSLAASSAMPPAARPIATFSSTPPAATGPTASTIGVVAVSNGSTASAGVAVAEVAVDMDGEGGGTPLGESASLSASQLAALAAAKYFRQASLGELQAAAFGAEAKPWQADVGEIVVSQAVSVEVLEQAASASPAAAPAPALTAPPSPAASPQPVRRQNLASRYVQLKLWVEAGQLPPPAAIDVDAIVRDAVPVYAAGTLRQVRAQAAVRALVDAPAGGSVADSSATLSAPSALPATAAPPTVIVPVESSATAESLAPAASAESLAARGRVTTASGAESVVGQHNGVDPAELAVLEARSLMLRLVRGYATILKDRPADASLQLDALAEQLRQRPRIARGRHGQEFLKLLEATRPLL